MMGQPAASRTAPGRSPRLWRAADVAAFYGVDQSTVHRWERAGRIRAARRDPGGTKYRVGAEIVDDALARPAPQPAASMPLSSLVAATRKRRSRR